MKDTEIIKALECCSSDDDESCQDKACPLFEHCKKDLNVLEKAALDLINRQKAEIEGLQKTGEEAVSCFTRMESLYKIKCKELEVAKSKAIKEFAERLKTKFQTNSNYLKTINFTINLFRNTIDHILVEMTEGNNENTPCIDSEWA